MTKPPRLSQSHKNVALSFDEIPLFIPYKK